MKIKSSFFIAVVIGSFLLLSSFSGKDYRQTIGNKNFSCVPDLKDEAERIVINNEYSVKIPSHMTKNNDLNSEASLQYADLKEELYIIVIDESVSEFVEAFKNEKGWNTSMTSAENYRRVQLSNMKKKMKFKGKPVIEKTKAGSLATEIVDFKGKVSGIDALIAYKIGFLECNDKLYMIMTWTTNDMLSKNNSEMNMMIKSFRSEI
ncbi:hypothetical protein BH09BAC5_BH09BAC5_10370 [soil metagenome]